MQLSSSVEINASRQDIWNTITDWENLADHISGIQSVEILEKPQSGIVGFKWKETRVMFGKEASETMWVTDATEPNYYQVGAASRGSEYETTFRILGDSQPYQLEMDFKGTPQTTGAKVMNALVGWMFKGAARKALHQDLEDIKSHLEKSE
ncbi:MAG: SRPBCC family protein [Bacteroidota bacterium]